MQERSERGRRICGGGGKEGTGREGRERSKDTEMKKNCEVKIRQSRRDTVLPVRPPRLVASWRMRIPHDTGINRR